jgi:hypothetical protein
VEPLPHRLQDQAEARLGLRIRPYHIPAKPLGLADFSPQT